MPDESKNKIKAVVFFIGGAGEKETYYLKQPHHHIEEVKIFFEKMLFEKIEAETYSSHYLDYKEVYKNKMQETVFAHIPTKKTAVFIIGHSLGGWNGAHLSRILSEEGYKVKILITLDPVGKGFWVYALSRIYYSKPKPVCDYWINISADPIEKDPSDWIAGLGEKWQIREEPDVNVSVQVHHYNTKKMMEATHPNGKSIKDYLLEKIISVLKV